MTSPSSPPVLPPPVRRPANAPLALEGIRVLDFTRYLSGPVGTMFLADMGADVIKVEHPDGGDEARKLPAFTAGGVGSVFLYGNRNKRSITLDLNRPQAQQVVLDLVAKVDVVVENFLPGVMDRVGLSYERLAQINPRLIYCSVSAFGREGKFARRPGYDQIAQAESGFISLSGEADGQPQKSASPVMDISTGMMTSSAILGALMARERGRAAGQFVEVCLYDTAVFMTGQYGMNYLVTGQAPQRHGNGSRTAEPTGLFEASDGPLYLSCPTDRSFQSLARRVLEMPELIEDERFATTTARCQHRTALHALLITAFARRGKEEWLDLALQASVPLGVVRTVPETMSSDVMQVRRLVSQIDAGERGMVPNIAAPMRFGATPLRDPQAAPALGQDTHDVLRELLGWDDARIDQLLAGG